MTPAGLPHSEILGSKPAWRLPEAYRSLPRPSSPAGAKASTVCPFYLFYPFSSIPYLPVKERWPGRRRPASDNLSCERLPDARITTRDHSKKPLPLTPMSNNGGGERIRTDDPLLARQVLSQLSYTPTTHAP